MRNVGKDEKDRIFCNGNAYCFIREPTGEGRGYSTREYSVVNCQAREISIWQEQPKGPVISILGIISDDILAQKAHIYDNIIVWHSNKQVVNYQISCKPNSMLTGEGLKYENLLWVKSWIVIIKWKSFII